jgi:hypothetical protein
MVYVLNAKPKMYGIVGSLFVSENVYEEIRTTKEYEL